MKSFFYLIIALFYIFPFHSFGSEAPTFEVSTGETLDTVPYYFKAVEVTWDSCKILADEVEKEKEKFSARRETLVSLGGRSKELDVVNGCLEVLEHLINAANRWRRLTGDNWIVSVVRKSDEAPLMRMCVVSDLGSTITHHIGICQTYDHFIGWEGRPRGISLQLHGFAAHFMLKRNPRRTFMVTTPLPVMESILDEAFGGNYFRVRLKRGKWPSLLVQDTRASEISFLDERWLENLHIYKRAIRLDTMQSKLVGFISKEGAK